MGCMHICSSRVGFLFIFMQHIGFYHFKSINRMDVGLGQKKPTKTAIFNHSVMLS